MWTDRHTDTHISLWLNALSIFAQTHTHRWLTGTLCTAYTNKPSQTLRDDFDSMHSLYQQAYTHKNMVIWLSAQLIIEHMHAHTQTRLTVIQFTVSNITHTHTPQWFNAHLHQNRHRDTHLTNSIHNLYQHKHTQSHTHMAHCDSMPAYTWKDTHNHSRTSLCLSAWPIPVHTNKK